MAVFKLLESDNAALQVKLEDCNSELNREEIKNNLIDTMKAYEGIGLSANQIGVLERVFVMYDASTLDSPDKKVIACFNPKVISESVNTVMIEEGCLSYPGLWIKVTRPESIGVEYEDENGKVTRDNLNGLQCRIFQHEYDHMEGSDFTKKVSKLKLDMAIKKQKKMEKLATKLKERTEARLERDRQNQILMS